MSLPEGLQKDVRFIEGLNACISSGVCTAICLAAAFNDYFFPPRHIADTAQRGNEHNIEHLPKSDTIWYCGECLSCKTQCPRNNTPGYIIQALRALFIKKGFFIESKKGFVWDWLKQNRQQILERLGTSYKKDESGTLRQIPEESLNDLQRIFDETGATARFEKLEALSAKRLKKWE